MSISVIVLSIVFALLRPLFIFREFNKHINQSYQAFAHILVGILLAAWWLTGKQYLMILFWMLTIVEVISAVVTAIRKRRHA